MGDVIVSLLMLCVPIGLTIAMVNDCRHMRANRTRCELSCKPHAVYTSDENTCICDMTKEVR